MSQYPLELVFLIGLLAGICVMLAVANLNLADKLANRDDALHWINTYGNLSPADLIKVRNALKGDCNG